MALEKTANLPHSRGAISRQIDGLIQTLSHNLSAWPETMNADYLAHLHELASQVGTLAARLDLARLKTAAHFLCEMLLSMHRSGSYNRDAALVVVRAMRLFFVDEEGADYDLILTELGRLRGVMSLRA